MPNVAGGHGERLVVLGGKPAGTVDPRIAGRYPAVGAAQPGGQFIEGCRDDDLCALRGVGVPVCAPSRLIRQPG
jgi:hypothetical protein